MTRSDVLVLGLGAALCVGGIGAAAWILRWEFRARRRQRRHGGWILGGGAQ